MTLYEIDANIQALLNDSINLETGEINQEAFEKLSQLQIDRTQKIENTVLFYKNELAMLEALKAEEKAINSRRKTYEKRIEGLKNYITYATDGSKFETPKVAISYRKSEVVEIEDEDAIPAEFVVVKTTRQAIKDDIRKAIKSGIDVPGARLQEKENVQIK